MASRTSRSLLCNARQQFVFSPRRFTTIRALQADDKPKSTKGLEPKILAADVPKEQDQSEDTKQHNREVKERTNKPVAQIATDDAPKDKEPPRNKDKVEAS